MTVRLVGWRPGFRGITVIGLLRRQTGEGLASAFAKMNAIVAGAQIDLEVLPEDVPGVAAKFREAGVEVIVG